MLYIRKNTKVHFIGIGGIGMSGIAEILHQLGHRVSGSDAKESANTQKLREMGVEVFIGHQASNVKDVTVVVYSSAIDQQNPEIQEAQKNNIPMIRRAEMLAELMRLKYGLAVAGTHGKTTTTSFLATILSECGTDATHVIGGIVENLGGHARVGKGDYLVAEADESDGSFLLLGPIMSIITNIDDDHLDHYGDMETLREAFLTFANKVPFYGLTVLNAHDEYLRAMIPSIKRPWLSFGIGEELKQQSLTAHYEARNVVYHDDGANYDLYFREQFATNIHIKLPGRHNVLNSLGPIVIAHNLGLEFANIAKGIEKFKTVGRRFEKLYEDESIEIIDDYAHHPTAVLKTLQMVRSIKKGKVVAIFEPHRYTRTQKCWKEFMHCFNDVDEVYLLPIYAASEQKIGGVSSKRLVEDINSLHPGMVHYLEDFAEIKNIVKRSIEAKKNKEKITFMFLGAGSIGKNVRELVKELKR